MGFLGAYGSVVVLFYRVSQLEKKDEQQNTNFETWRAEMHEAIKDSTERADVDLQKYIAMEKQEHVIIISSFERAIDKISVKIDKLMDYNLEQANRRRATDKE